MSRSCGCMNKKEAIHIHHTQSRLSAQINPRGHKRGSEVVWFLVSWITFGRQGGKTNNETPPPDTPGCPNMTPRRNLTCFEYPRILQILHIPREESQLLQVPAAITDNSNAPENLIIQCTSVSWATLDTSNNHRNFRYHRNFKY